MKHIKKFLFIALTLTMLINIMAISAFAVFTDQDQIAHKEAVEKLVSWNIIKGRDQGEFDPNSFVTRAEMSKMICIALNGGKEPSLSTSSTPTYWDTKGHWGEKYIEYCCDLGIVAGYGDGSFSPNANVTIYQAAKIMLTALGYNATNEGFTGASWQITTAVRATQAGLFTGINIGGPNSPLKRDDAAQLIYNGIMSPTPQYTSATQSALTGQSIYSIYFQNMVPSTNSDNIITASIIGTWSYSSTYGPGIICFKNDGTFEVFEYQEYYQGLYKISGNNITLSKDENEITGNINSNGDINIGVHSESVVMHKQNDTSILGAWALCDTIEQYVRVYFTNGAVIEGEIINNSFKPYSKGTYSVSGSKITELYPTFTSVMNYEITNKNGVTQIYLYEGGYYNSETRGWMNKIS